MERKYKIKLLLITIILIAIIGQLAYFGYKQDTEPTPTEGDSPYIAISIIIFMIIMVSMIIAMKKGNLQPGLNRLSVQPTPQIKLKPIEKMKCTIRIGKFDERLGPICLNAVKGTNCDFAERECDEITTRIIIDALGVNQKKFTFEEENWNYQVINFMIPNPSARGQNEKYAIIIKYDKKHGKITDEYIEIIRDDFLSLFREVSISPSLESLRRFSTIWEENLYEADSPTDIAEKQEEIEKQINNNDDNVKQKRSVIIALTLGVLLTGIMVAYTAFRG